MGDLAKSSLEYPLAIEEKPLDTNLSIEFGSYPKTKEQIISEAEEAPFAIAGSFGEVVASKILHPNSKGELEMVIDESGVVFLPGSDTVIFSPSVSTLQIEKFLRQPVTDLLNRSTKDLIPIALKFDSIKKLQDDIDKDDLSEMSVHKYINESRHGDSGPSLPQMRALLKARLAKDEQNNLDSVNKMDDTQVSSLYNQYYPGGPQSGETRTGVNIIQPVGSETDSPDLSITGNFDPDTLLSYEEMISRINNSIKLNPGETQSFVNLSEAYLRPIADPLNTLIRSTMQENPSGKIYGPYWSVNKAQGRMIGSLLYKRYNQEPSEANKNLTPLVLNKDVVILKGSRGTIGEKTEIFILKKVDEDWYGKVLHSNTYDLGLDNVKIAEKINDFFLEEA